MSAEKDFIHHNDSSSEENAYEVEHVDLNSNVEAK